MIIHYFSHDIFARENLKIKRLLGALQFEGYGIFWALIEFLHNNANKIKVDEVEIVAHDLGVEKEKIESIIYDFNLFFIKKNVISSRRVAKNFKLQKEKSKKAKESASKRWKVKADYANALPTHCERIAIKEKKGKEIKEKKGNKGKEKKGNKAEEVFGSHKNVFLSPVQREALLARAKSEKRLEEVINEFSENIATKKELVFDEDYKDMHFLRLERYLKVKTTPNKMPPEAQKEDPKRFDALNYVKKLKEEGGISPPPEFFKGKEELMKRLGRGVSDTE